MKKIFLIIGCMLLTGCTKSVMCSNITESESLNIKEDIIIKYSNNKVKFIDDNIVYDVKDDILKQNFINVFNDVKSNYDRDLISYKYSINNDSYVLEVMYSPYELSDDTLEKINVSTNLSEYSMMLMKQGFKCK